MANSRLERIGTIFTRTTALLKTGAKKHEDKPLWYDIYKAFPPKLEPLFGRPAPNVETRPIFYQEDKIRAWFYKNAPQTQVITLSNTDRPTECQQFIEIYNKLKAQGPLSEEKILETSLVMLQEKLQVAREERANAVGRNDVPSLSERFTAATPTTSVDIKDVFESEISESFTQESTKTTARGEAPDVDIKNIFKD